MSVGFSWIDFDRRFKTANGLGGLAALLVNQSELILRLAIVRIHRRGVQHAAKVLAGAQPASEIPDLTAEIVERVEKKERRREHVEDAEERIPDRHHRGERNPGESGDG